MGMCLQLRRCDVATIAELRANPDAAGDFAAPDCDTVPEGELIDLDKAWHAIHFLLGGGTDGTHVPRGALFAGEPMGEDFGLGPARLLSVADTKTFADFLRLKPDDFIEQTLDFATLEAADIYPDIWDRQEAEDIAYVAGYFRTLKSFVLASADSGSGIVILLM